MSSKTATKSRALTIFFIGGTVGENGLHVHFQPQVMELLCKSAGMTLGFLADIYECNDWTVFPTASSIHEGTFPISAVQYGFWVWQKSSTHSFTQVFAGADSTTYFCVNFLDTLQDHICKTVESLESQANRPLFIDVLIAESVLASYRAAIADKRAVLLAIEKNQHNNKTSDDASYEAQTTKLHHLAVAWHIFRKDLQDIVGHVRHLRSLAGNSAAGPSQVGLAMPNSYFACSSADEALRRLEDCCLFWARWVDTYGDRTSIRINLMHNLVAQRDSQLNQKIALQAQRDSVSMSTLAAVAAVFLPGTFVCSVLSTVFFSYDGVDTGLAVSPLWWILPVSAVPLTVLVLTLWFWWYRDRLSRTTTKLRSQEAKLEAGGWVGST
ncbi:hypothetical protein B0T24DRAFT_642152 [Lasiosphaeria ovina]|uniref:Uncharacterized protein n=1 Tax=Lasiosphaeria ovina TaxID=92902 RepID=A0AAE0JUB8_9PEZI|nr:hypothetical protein B0T24DRAFT_642152 [Lasiosphaeria ovina]